MDGSVLHGFYRGDEEGTVGEVHSHLLEPVADEFGVLLEGADRDVVLGEECGKVGLVRVAQVGADELRGVSSVGVGLWSSTMVART